MVFSPSHYLFTTTLILGILVATCSNSWFGAWMGLELNLLSFIPLISMKDNQYSSEAALKYFLIQALGSTVLLISGMMILMKMQMFSASLSAALLLKSGAAPFHFWFPPTLEGMMWPQALMLMTIQKIAPMSLLSYYITEQSSLISMSIVMSAIVGALGGLNQTLLRKLLAYSSINHMAWMMTALMISESTWLVYFMIYSLMSISVVLMFYFMQTFHFNHLINQMSAKPILKLMMFTSLLSMGGLPPFTGFIPKWMVIQQLCSSSNFFLLVILLASSLFTLFYYLRITLSSFMLSSTKMKWSVMLNLDTKLVVLMVTINFLGLLIPSMMYSMLM